jgi:hypothetical protein
MKATLKLFFIFDNINIHVIIYIIEIDLIFVNIYISKSCVHISANITINPINNT